MTHEQATAFMADAMKVVHNAGFDVWGWDDGSVMVSHREQHGKGHAMFIEGTTDWPTTEPITGHCT